MSRKWGDGKLAEVDERNNFFMTRRRTSSEMQFFPYSSSLLKDGPYGDFNAVAWKMEEAQIMIVH